MTAHPLVLMFEKAFNDKVVESFDYENNWNGFKEIAYLDTLSASYTLIKEDPFSCILCVYITWKPTMMWYRFLGEGHWIEEMNNRPYWIENHLPKGIVIGNWFFEKLKTIT